MDNEYYILDKGQKLGPFTTRELMDRPLEPSDIILLPSQTQGVPAYSMDEFEDYFKLEGIYYPTKQNTAAYFLRLPAFIIDIFILSIGTSILMSILLPQYLLQLQTMFPANFLADPKWQEKLLQHRSEIFIMNIVFFVVMVLYNTACEAGRMRASVGKYILGLAVVDELGYSISFGQAFLRNIGKLIYEIPSLIIGIVGYVTYLRMVWTEKHQAFHDQFSGCYIVKKNG